MKILRILLCIQSQ